MADHTLRCVREGRDYPLVEGIWRFLEKSGEDERFIEHYRQVRSTEAWGNDRSEYYRRLPEVASDDRNRAIWAVRAASFRQLLRFSRRRPPCTILDLGAGNSWLSYRLGLEGHRVFALDLSDDRQDGLGVRWAFGEEPPFTSLQASFERVPLCDGTVDVAIFNGSLHYTRCLEDTLAEACRVLSPHGVMIVMDSPFYRSEAAGAAMLEERARAWSQRAAGPVETSTVRPEIGFLTVARLERAGHRLSLCFVHQQAHGIRPRLAKLRALLAGRREPAHFPFVVARREV